MKEAGATARTGMLLYNPSRRCVRDALSDNLMEPVIKRGPRFVCWLVGEALSKYRAPVRRNT